MESPIWQRHGRALLLASAALACAACSESAPPAGAPEVAARPAPHGKAEYAYRWLLPRKDFDDAQQVIDALKGAPPNKPPKERSVAYYTAVSQEALPEGYAASLRRRSDSKDGKDFYEFTYKVRGPAPRPSTLSTPAICTALHGEMKEETDVTVQAGTRDSVRNFSTSCSIDQAEQAPPKEFQLAPDAARPCAMSMARSKLDWPGKQPLKIEAWTFRSPAGSVRSLLEVSWEASTDPQDEALFRQRIAPLLEGSTDAPPPGKERMAEKCDADAM